MAVESEHPSEQQMPPGRALQRTLLLLGMAMLFLGGAAAPLFTRIYFLHGGTRLWLTSLLQNCAFPIFFLPLTVSYLRRKGPRRSAGVFSVTHRAAAALVVLGVVAGLGGYMLAYGSASLPVSTSSLLSATQLGFTAGFAFLLVRQKFTPYSINAVVLLLVGPVILGLNSGGDRPSGESDRRYYLGFFLSLGAAAVLGLLLPLIELTRINMKRNVTHVLVLEMQVIVAASASAFCVVAMLINKDFQAIQREAREYGLGERKYYLVLTACAIFWQLMNLGFIGVISCSSSLLAGIVQAMLVPVVEVLPVLLLHEKFNGGKGVAMALSIWGFVSYLYGEYKQTKKQKQMAGEESASPATPQVSSGVQLAGVS